MDKMNRKISTMLLLVVISLTSCMSNAENILRETPIVTEETPPNIKELSPGVYITNEPTFLPLPTSGYTMYIVGEQHGNREAKIFFLEYLQRLHQEADLRDIVLEEDQFYESEANAYTQGLTDDLIPALCLRTDILTLIREYNSTLPDDEKIIVHLVDVDSPLLPIYSHLKSLYEEMGTATEAVPLPGREEFEHWNIQSTPALTIVDELIPLAGDNADIINGLETVRSSYLYYYNGNETGPTKNTGSVKYALIREEAIARNISHLLKKLDGKLVLAFFGGFHALKTMGAILPPGAPIDMKSWAQIIIELDDVDVYSVEVSGLSGQLYWRGKEFSPHEGLGEYQFSDGTPLSSLFENEPDYNLLYTDLRVDENYTIWLGPDYHQDVPAGQMYDGLVMFKEVTPMEDQCP
jgi:hypothetical protein